eukprot:9108734-Heterocapsa_arctica.AAC.1
MTSLPEIELEFRTGGAQAKEFLEELQAKIIRAMVRELKSISKRKANTSRITANTSLFKSLPVDVAKPQGSKLAVMHARQLVYGRRDDRRSRGMFAS